MDEILKDANKVDLLVVRIGQALEHGWEKPLGFTSYKEAFKTLTKACEALSKKKGLYYEDKQLKVVYDDAMWEAENLAENYKHGYNK